MLVGQAVAQVELMTGRTVAADVMMQAGRAALGVRGEGV
jgi:shikimate 5-dehydrogenase